MTARLHCKPMYHLTRLLSVVAISCAITTHLHAAEWSAEPDISLKTGYNDNILLDAGPHSSVWENILSLFSTFSVDRENQGISGEAGARIKRYSGGSGRESSEFLNREDYLFLLDGYHQTTRNIFRANLDYIRDSTLDDEVDVSGNVSNVYATRIKKSAGLSWATSLTEKLQLDAGYIYNDVSFADDPGQRDLIPYTGDTLNASLSYRYSPRIAGVITGARNTFKPDTGFNSETLSLQAGVNSALSETLDLSLLAGYRETTSDTLFLTGFCIGANPGATFPECQGGIPVPTGTEKGETKTSGPVYSLSLTKRYEKGSLGASFTRVTRPGLNGQLLDNNQFRLNGNYRLTELLNTSLDILYAENETIVNAVGREPDDVTQKFFRITPRINWRWRRGWTVSAEYQFAEVEKRVTSNIARRNAIYAILTYTPTKLSISR